MPTATPFIALGRGNGFPFCLEHRTEAEIAARCVQNGLQQRLRKNFSTLAEVMAVFWNIYSFSIEVPTSTGSGHSDQRSILKARIRAADIWFDEYGFYPAAGENPSRSPKWRCGFTGNGDVVSPLWWIVGGEVTQSPVGPYGLTNDDDFGDPMPEATGDVDRLYQEEPFFAPTFYYNTDLNNYAIVWRCSIREVINFNQFAQPYVLSSVQFPSHQSVTMTMFGESYDLYSGDYLTSYPPNFDTEMQPGGDIAVTTNEFSYG